MLPKTSDNSVLIVDQVGENQIVAFIGRFSVIAVFIGKVKPALNGIFHFVSEIFQNSGPKN